MAICPFRIVYPDNNSSYVWGDPIRLILEKEDVQQPCDSLLLFFGNQKFFVLDDTTRQVILSTFSFTVGKQGIDIVCYCSGAKAKKSVSVTLLSDIVPQQYSYRIINRYPHDRTAYTQGLIYDNGTLIESTGQYGHSSLRRLDLYTGKVLQAYKLPEKYFAEGIAVDDKYIYQISYKEQTGFIYDKKSFSLVNTFYYPYAEGWGLEYDGQHLLMTDGSNKIYFFDKETFQQKRILEVYDNQGPVYYLNELEIINNVLFANVYTQDYILMIDLQNGKVTGRINMQKILSEKLRNKNTDVLNGIAWDKVNNRIFVTGKNWPELFEIEIVKI